MAESNTTCRRDPAPNATCVVCGKARYVSPGHMAKGWGRYCSFACRSVERSGAGHARWRGGPVDCTCLKCGKSFTQKVSHVAIGEGKYCSIRCKADALRGVYRPCRRCGKSIWVWKKGATQQRYCSRDCRYATAACRTLNRSCEICGRLFHMAAGALRRVSKRCGRFCSMTCKAQWMSANASRKPSGSGGKRDDLGGLYVRSSWEANYARYLKWLVSLGEIRSWEFEPDTFAFDKIKRGTRFYTPDFKVTNSNGSVEYHEVKGYMTPESATKMRRMKRYYPSIKVVLIDGPQYRAIARKVSKIVPCWEGGVWGSPRKVA